MNASAFRVVTRTRRYETMLSDATAPGSQLDHMGLAFEIDDADAWSRRLRASDARVASSPEDMPWGHRTFTVSDPDGLRISLYHVIDGS